MPDLVLTEREQSCVRALMALEPAPGGLPPAHVLTLISRLVPSDTIDIHVADATGFVIDLVSLPPEALVSIDPQVCDGPALPGPFPQNLHGPGPGHAPDDQPGAPAPHAHPPDVRPPHIADRDGAARPPARRHGAVQLRWACTTAWPPWSPSTSFIQTFRLKYDVGYWRPFQAIAGAGSDGNPDTTPQTGWTPLVTNPAYSDYTSGHAAATGSWVEVVRRTLGDDTDLTLRIGAQTRSYDTLTALEYDTLHARIWGGLHFRDAMDDGYLLAHTTAVRVMAAIH